MKRECFMPSKHSRVCVKHFTEESFEQNLVVRSFLGPSFKLRQLVEKKDVVPTIFNFSMQLCKLANGEKKNNETQVNNAHRTAGESSTISSKIRFVFKYKAFLTKNSLRQKRSNASVSFFPLKCAVILETFS